MPITYHIYKLLLSIFTQYKLDYDIGKGKCYYTPAYINPYTKERYNHRQYFPSPRIAFLCGMSNTFRDRG